MSIVNLYGSFCTKWKLILFGCVIDNVIHRMSSRRGGRMVEKRCHQSNRPTDATIGAPRDLAAMAIPNAMVATAAREGRLLGQPTRNR